MIVPGLQICCRYEIVLPGPRRSIDRGILRLQDIGEKAKQTSASNNAKGSKCFQFLCNNSNEHGFSMHKHLSGPLGGVENRGIRPRFSTPPTGPDECLCMKNHV